MELPHIPGRDGWPLVGRVLEVLQDLQDLHAVAAANVKNWGHVSRLRLLGQGGLMVTGADNYQRIFQDPEQLFSAEQGYDPDGTTPPAGPTRA